MDSVSSVQLSINIWKKMMSSLVFVLCLVLLLFCFEMSFFFFFDAAAL